MSAVPDQRTQPLRIGAVNYLNAKPLVHGLAESLPDAVVSFELPSRLADQLASGALDAALAPCVELAAHPEWSVISTACIGSHGPVLSVKLLFRVPPSEVRTLALDEGSRTSAVLAQILLADRFGMRPRLAPLRIGAAATDSRADAVLVIGDRAIAAPPPQFIESWDLGAQWHDWIGLPMVFAMWMARPGFDFAELETALDGARDRGVESLEQIATAQARTMGLEEHLVRSYLRDNLHFYLGPTERAGLDEFFRRAAALDLISPENQLRFDDCPTKHSQNT